jgi:phage gpG-like protein
MINFSLSVPSFNLNWWEASRNELARILLEDNQASWSTEQDPQTQGRWAPLSPAYASSKSRAYPGVPILRRTGTMQDKTRILPQASRGIFSARMGSSYGSYHMNGTSRMPARPWLGVPVSSMPKMEEAISRAILKGRNRRV